MPSHEEKSVVKTAVAPQKIQFAQRQDDRDRVAGCGSDSPAAFPSCLLALQRFFYLLALRANEIPDWHLAIFPCTERRRRTRGVRSYSITDFHSRFAIAKNATCHEAQCKDEYSLAGRIPSLLTSHDVVSWRSPPPSSPTPGGGLRHGRRLLLNDGCRGRRAGARTWTRGGTLLVPRVLLGQVAREPLELLGVGLAGEGPALEQHRLDALLQQHGHSLPHRLLRRLAAARRPPPAAGVPSHQ
jgi:hypothetical protein